jgi:hypothetical protein
MWCVDRVQRIIMAMVMFITIGIFIKSLVIGAIFLGFVGLMLMVWGLFDFCPMTFILGKFLPQCKCKENSNEQD